MQKNKNTQCSAEISQPPWTGGGSLKNDNSVHDCKKQVPLNTILKSSPDISINPLTQAALSPPDCIAAANHYEPTNNRPAAKTVVLFISVLFY